MHRTDFILNTYINSSGNVDYHRLENDNDYRAFLQYLKNADISGFTKTEEMTFWLNAYNFLVIENVFTELSKNRNWKGNTNLYRKYLFFFKRRFRIAGKKINLYSIENRIIRKKFRDPRIHFILNCASTGCPVIPGRIIKAENIENLLNNAATLFINDEHNVKTDSSGVLHLSKIFKWYRQDFHKAGGVIKFINKYQSSKKKIPDKTRIRYYKYDWKLNSQ